MLSKMLRAAAGRSTSPTTDPNFNQVSVLLHGDGTNGTQNNTFIDSSTNNFSITRTGTPTQGTYTPFSQAAGYWSNYFNGTTDALTTPDNAAFTLGTNNFTIEAWIYTSSTTTTRWVVGQVNSTFVLSSASFLINQQATTNTIRGGVCVGSTFYGVESSSAIPLNQWVHIAFVRDTTNLKIYVNGVLGGTTAISTLSVNDSTNQVAIGRPGEANVEYWSGYISNFRLVNGTAVYTSNFTPSTTPLSAITNTKLLTCQSSRFLDNSSNNFTITPTGTPSVQPWSAFAPTTAYSTSTNGGSMYFNGTTDFISAAYSSSFNIGTGNFTLECWVYSTNISGIRGVAGNHPSVTTGGIGIYVNGGVPNGEIFINGTSVGAVGTTGPAIQANTWNHLALVRNGTSFVVYTNGVAGTAINTSNNPNNTSPFYVSNFEHSVVAYKFLGYIANTRFVVGTAVYTANFTPPTAPLTAITNTALLLNGINAGIYDNAIKSDSITVGAAQVNTSVVKYGTGSVSFNGTTSYLNFPNNTYYAFGTASWTIEAWVYTNSVTTAQTIIDTRSTATATTGVKLALSTTGFPFVTINNATLFTSSSALTISTWTHVALVKNGTTVTLYLNGTSTGSATSATSLTDQFLRIGASAGTAAQFYNGYLDDVRITNGIARYTASFTPPTQAFPNQ
jgi:Concanavalin A-like lectin/glucanases superfamily